MTSAPGMPMLVLSVVGHAFVDIFNFVVVVVVLMITAQHAAGAGGDSQRHHLANGDGMRRPGPQNALSGGRCRG